MAQLVLTDASVVINSVDLSDHVKSITLNYAADMNDDSAMGDTTHSRIGGLLDWSMDIELQQDYAASKTDATLFALVGTTFTVTVKPTSSAVSATNPSFSGTGILESYPPIAGAVGDEALASITIQSAGTLTRATS
jgi:hypothetical protein